MFIYVYVPSLKKFKIWEVSKITKRPLKHIILLMQVVLSDGDLSTLANLKVNLDLNQMNAHVECLHLPWESALENDLQNLKPDIV